MKYLYLLFIIVTAMTFQALSPEEEQALRELLSPEEFSRVTRAAPQPGVQGSASDE